MNFQGLTSSLYRNILFHLAVSVSVEDELVIMCSSGSEELSVRPGCEDSLSLQEKGMARGFCLRIVTRIYPKIFRVGGHRPPVGKLVFFIKVAVGDISSTYWYEITS